MSLVCLVYQGLPVAGALLHDGVECSILGQGRRGYSQSPKRQGREGGLFRARRFETLDQ